MGEKKRRWFLWETPLRATTALLVLMLVAYAAISIKVTGTTSQTVDGILATIAFFGTLLAWTTFIFSCFGKMGWKARVSWIGSLPIAFIICCLLALNFFDRIQCVEPPGVWNATKMLIRSLLHYYATLLLILVFGGVQWWLSRIIKRGTSAAEEKFQKIR